MYKALPAFNCGGLHTPDKAAFRKRGLVSSNQTSGQLAGTTSTSEAFAAGQSDADFANRILNYRIRSLSVLLHFKAENRALRPLRVADRDFRVPRIRDAHRPQWNAHVEEVFSGLNQRIGM
jgi:hypothetical protein